MEIRYPRIVHAEMVRHRAFSRSVASSRAIPVEKQIKKIVDAPFVPEEWRANQRGMVAGDVLSDEDSRASDQIWMSALESMLAHTQKLVEKNVHKELANRLLECFSWTTEIVSGTDWINFYELRVHPDAQPQCRRIAALMCEVHRASTPISLDYGDWHMPLLREIDETLPTDTRLKVSAGRCARTSYETHDGLRNVHADVQLGSTLAGERHYSPLEHQARPKYPEETQVGNLYGWAQQRHVFDLGPKRTGYEWLKR
jgi:thymidylate synthase ThyX